MLGPLRERPRRVSLGVVGIRPASREVAAYGPLELPDRRNIDLDAVAQEMAQIALATLHLVAVEEPSSHVDPVVGRRAGLGHHSEGGEEHAVSCHAIAPHGRKAVLEALQEVQGREHCGLTHVRAVERISDELCEGDRWVVEGGSGRWRGVWALKRVDYETGAEFGEVSTTVIRIVALRVMSHLSD